MLFNLFRKNKPPAPAVDDYHDLLAIKIGVQACGDAIPSDGWSDEPIDPETFARIYQAIQDRIHADEEATEEWHQSLREI